MVVHKNTFRHHTHTWTLDTWNDDKNNSSWHNSWKHPAICTSTIQIKLLGSVLTVLEIHGKAEWDCMFFSLGLLYQAWNTHGDTHTLHSLSHFSPISFVLFPKLSFSLFTHPLNLILLFSEGHLPFLSCSLFYHTNWLHHFWTSLIFLPLLSHQTFFCQLILAVLGLRRACLRFTF